MLPSRGFLDKLASLAARRRLEDLTVGPVLTVTTAEFQAHIDALLRIPGARLLFGGKPLAGHSIPPQYGAVEPTAVYVPLEEMLKEEHFSTVSEEIFAPFQVGTWWCLAHVTLSRLANADTSGWCVSPSHTAVLHVGGPLEAADGARLCG